MEVKKWTKINNNEIPEVFDSVVISNDNIKEITFTVNGLPYRITTAWDNILIHKPTPPAMKTAYILRYEILPGTTIVEKFSTYGAASKRINVINKAMVNAPDIEPVEEEIPEDEWLALENLG